MIRADQKSLNLGVTLIELLVSMAILGLIGFLVVGITNEAASATEQSNQRMSAESSCRQALDRIATDLERAILRPDLPSWVDSQQGNDAVGFLAQADGYSATSDPQRGVSKIRYRVRNGQLERGAEALNWSETGNPLRFGSEPFGVGNDSDFEIVAPNVIRFEVAFQMADGSIRSTVPTLVAEDSSDPSDQVHSVVISVAALDSKTKPNLTAEAIRQLEGVLTDAVAGGPDAANHGPISEWQSAVENSALTGQTGEALRSLRFQQRIIPLQS